VAPSALYVGNKTHATGVVLIGGVVQTLCHRGNNRQGWMIHARTSSYGLAPERRG
jgi:hypothetical protein